MRGAITTFLINYREAMKKVQRLTEIKRQLGLTEKRMERANLRRISLLAERQKVVESLTMDEKRLYKGRIERACK